MAVLDSVQFMLDAALMGSAVGLVATLFRR